METENHQFEENREITTEDKIRQILDQFYNFDVDMQNTFIPVYKQSGFTLAGSLVEGAFAIPFMAPLRNKTLDFDIMFPYGTISKELSSSVLQETCYDGYYRVLNSDQLKEAMFESMEYLDFSSDYLAPIGSSCETTAKACPSTKVQLSASSLTGYTSYFNDIITKSELDDSLTIPFTETINDIISRSNTDVVHFLKLDFWPQSNADWSTRKRHWPNQNIVNKIHAMGCGLVWKSVGDQKFWRLSFTSAENELAKQRSEFQQKSFLLAKIIFCLLIDGIKCREIEERQLSTYHLKTMMFFLMEETPQAVWQALEDGGSYLGVVDMLFHRFIHCLRNGKMYNYFMSENLLLGYTQTHMNQVAFKLNGFVADQHRSSYLLTSLTESAFLVFEKTLSNYYCKNYPDLAFDYSSDFCKLCEESYTCLLRSAMIPLLPLNINDRIAKLFSVTNITKSRMNDEWIRAMYRSSDIFDDQLLKHDFETMVGNCPNNIFKDVLCYFFSNPVFVDIIKEFTIEKLINLIYEQSIAEKSDIAHQETEEHRTSVKNIADSLNVGDLIKNAEDVD